MITKLYALVLKGTHTCVLIEEGLYYGLPCKSNRIEFLDKEKLNKLLENPNFTDNILKGRCEIREVVVHWGDLIKLVVVPPAPQEKKYSLPE
jgi:hypothetical protein